MKLSDCIKTIEELHSYATTLLQFSPNQFGVVVQMPSSKVYFFVKQYNQYQIIDDISGIVYIIIYER